MVKLGKQDEFYSMLTENFKDSNVMVRSLMLTTKKIIENSGIKNSNFSDKQNWKVETGQTDSSPKESQLFHLPILNNIALQHSESYSKK